MRKVSISLIAIAIAGLGALPTSPAIAANAYMPEFEFPYDIRELENEAGERRIMRDLRRAAHRYCRVYMSGGKTAVAGCRRYILQQAAQRLKDQ